MKKVVLIIVFACSVTACNNSAQERIENLNGYWEIKSAVTTDGEQKEYPFSPMVDYIEVQGMKGFRKKMKPQLDGTYTTSEDKELLTVEIENDRINLHYETPFSSWTERLISATEEELKIESSDGTIYTYKRFTPYLSSHEEEK